MPAVIGYLTCSIRLRHGIRLLVSAACLMAWSCSERPVGSPLGAPCEPPGDCEDGLVCEYSRCRFPCATEADCGPESACVGGLRDVTFRVCTLPAEEDCPSTPCPERLYCGPDGICHEWCRPDRPCVEGWECTDEICLPLDEE